MRNELLSWFAHEGMLLTDIVASADDPENDEIKVIIKAPLIALSKDIHDYRECPDPVLFGYPEESLEMMTMDDMHAFVMSWIDRAVEAGMMRCFVCNRVVGNDVERPWDAVFISSPLFCWLVVHFDCKRYLQRDLKGRDPFEVTAQPPEFFDLKIGA